jgi:hypothetical protein
MILYVPFFTVGTYCYHNNSVAKFASQSLFAITPLNWSEWKAVLYLSAPVLVIDEVLKFVSVSSLHLHLYNVHLTG